VIRLADQDRRRAQALKAEIRAIERPAKDAARKERKAASKARDTGRGQLATWERQRRERDPAFLQWIRRLPCVAGLVKGGCLGPIEAAHLRYSDAARGRVNPGMQKKPSDRYATPLCNSHHQSDQHARRERDFWADLHIEPGDLTDALYAAFQAGEDGSAVLKQFTTRGF
jgi:hypothetical protein